VKRVCGIPRWAQAVGRGRMATATKHNAGSRAHVKKVGATCGAKRKKGGKCTMAAGWGTSHPGIGACKLHGGSMPNHVRSAAKQEMRNLLGTPREVTPEQAILDCIRIRSGEIEWLSQEMTRLSEASWVEETMLGKQFHLYARERQAALRDVARFSQMAIQMNVEERRVRIAETYGESIAMLLKGILDELMPNLNEEGRKAAPAIVRRHLVLLQTPEKQAIPQKASG
jgi:hypothetical protein